MEMPPIEVAIARGGPREQYGFRRSQRGVAADRSTGFLLCQRQCSCCAAGLEVEDLGPIALPLTVQQAKELKKHCEQAPYGKGEKTIVDTNVRRVWHMTP